MNSRKKWSSLVALGILSCIYMACSKDEEFYREYYSRYHARALVDGREWVQWPLVTADYAFHTEAFFNREGKHWIEGGRWHLINIKQFSFNTDDHDSLLYWRQSLSFGAPSQETIIPGDTLFLKKSELSPDDGFRIKSPYAILHFLDHDAIFQTYHVIETDSMKNWILLKREKNGDVYGRFQMAMKAENEDPWWPQWMLPWPDTIYVTDGEFLASPDLHYWQKMGYEFW